VRIPEGWNASVGPDRFEGIGPVGTDNTKALERSRWYAGLAVTEAIALADHNPTSSPASGTPRTTWAWR
jgi:hypothetical protein